MAKIRELAQKIDDTRKCMNEIIKQKGDLLDPEVIIASQKLDSILNEYYKILSKTIDK